MRPLSPEITTSSPTLDPVRCFRATWTSVQRARGVFASSNALEAGSVEVVLLHVLFED